MNLLNDLTLITCSFNTPDVTLTMLRSYVAHHGDGPHRVIIMENSTEEETRHLLHANDIPYVPNPGGTHSPSVDRALDQCATRYALLLDTDIVFNRPIHKLLELFRRHELTLMGAVCGDRGGYRLHPRVHPWFCLMDAADIRRHGIRFHDEERIRRTGSDGFFKNIPIQQRADGEDTALYDVGATFYEDIDRAGLRIGHAELEPYFFTHYEGMSWHRKSGLDGYVTLGARAANVFLHAHEKYGGIDLFGRFAWKHSSVPSDAASESHIRLVSESPSPHRGGGGDGSPSRTLIITSNSMSHPGNYARLHEPMSALSRAGRMRYEMLSGPTPSSLNESQSAVRKAELIVLRTAGFADPTVKRSLRPARQAGTPLLVDLDPCAAFGDAGGDATAPVTEMENAIRVASVVTTRTRGEAQWAMERGGRQIVVIPEAIDPASWPGQDPCLRSDRNARGASTRLRITCPGDATLSADREALVAVIVAIVERHGESVIIEYPGSVPTVLKHHPSIREVAPPEDRYVDHARRLCLAQVDLAIVPIASGPADWSRSNRPWLEYSAAGIPGIYGKSTIYDEVIRNEENGFVAGSDPTEWTAILDGLIRQPEMRIRIAGQAHRRVMRDFTVDRTLPLWEMALDLAWCGETTRSKEISAADNGTLEGSSKFPDQLAA